MNNLVKVDMQLAVNMMAIQAEKNLKKYGLQDMETLGLALAEECGEVCQAILQHRDEGGAHVEIRKEAVDLGALCIQVILLYAHKHGAENVMKALSGESRFD